MLMNALLKWVIRTKVEQNTEDKKQQLISEALKKYNR